MKILTVADTVSNELLEPVRGGPLYTDIDLVISCGDLPPEYLSSLKHRYDVPLMYVLGNHDLRYGSSPPAGCRYIDRQMVTFNDKRIVGFSGSRWYNGGMNQYTEKEMGSFIGKMRFTLWRNGAPDIVVTHAAPRHVKDAEDRCHKGFKSFHKIINKYNPSHFFHGHIHKLFEDDAERTTVVNTTQVINSYGFYILEIQSTANSKNAL